MRMLKPVKPYREKHESSPFILRWGSLLLLLMASMCVTTATAQNFPPASSCTSKELDMVDMLLQSDQTGFDHVSGKRKMKLTITNKTGSDRKSFVLWGTLKRFDSYGNLKNTEPIFICVDSVRRNSTVTLPSKDSIYYNEDENLLITNIYTAWSSASVNENCQTISADISKIAPRCAVKDSFRVYTGVNARFNHQRSDCDRGRGKLKTVPFGGKGPYKITISRDDNSLVQDTITVNDRDSLDLELPPGDYKVSVVDGRRNATVFSRKVDHPFPMDKPQLQITHPWCALPKGLVKVMNMDKMSSYKLSQNGALKYALNNDQFEEVDEGQYMLVAERGICRSVDSIRINPRPFIPGKPEVSVTHPDCLRARGKVNLNKKENNVSYVLMQNDQIRYTAAEDNFNEVDSGEYQLVAKGMHCHTPGDPVKVHPKPPRPDKPNFNHENPSCFAPRGLVRVLNRDANAAYHLVKNGVITYTLSDSNTFAEVDSGAYSLVAVRGSCNNSDSVYIKARPFIPGAPEWSATQPDCLRATGKVKLNKKENNVAYFLVQNGQDKYTPVEDEFPDVDSGEYQLVARGQHCSTHGNVKIHPKPPRPDKPNFNQQNPSCFAPRGLVRVLNRDANAAYHLVKNGIITYTLSDSNTFAEVDSGAYSLVAVRGSCNNSDSVYIKARPFIPGAPDWSATQPDCLNATGRVKLNKKENNVAYFLVQNGQDRYTPVDDEFTGVDSGDYQLVARGQHCSTGTGVKIHPKPPRPDKPNFNQENPSCFAPRGLVRVLNRDANAAYHLVKNGIITYTLSDSNTFAEVDSGAYSLVAVRGSCNNSDSVYIKARPFIPGAPDWSATQPDCLNATGRVKLNKKENNVGYFLVQNGQDKYTPIEDEFTGVDSGDYQLVARGQHCSTGTGVKIYPKPPRPDKPNPSITNPSCTAPLGLVRVLNKDANASYHLVQNGIIMYTSTNDLFEDVAAGAYSLVAVRGDCNHADSVYIKARPFIPSNQRPDITQPDCLVATGKVKLSKQEMNVTYYLTQGNVKKYTSQNGEFAAVDSGRYQLLAEGTHCNAADSLVVNAKPPRPNKPTPDITNPSCTAPLGLVRVLNKDANASYHLVQNGVIMYTSANDLFENVAAGAYSLVAVRGECNHADSVYIKARPFIPSNQSPEVTQPDCLVATGKVKLSKQEANVTYYLTQANVKKYTSQNGEFAAVDSGRYQLLAEGTHCNAADSLVVNAKPPRPDKPNSEIRNPSCIEALGQVRVKNKDAYASYYLKQGGVIKYTSTNDLFENVATGVYALVAVRGECNNADTVNILARPFIPAQPLSSRQQPDCVKATGTVTLAKTEETVTYYLTQGNVTKYTATEGVFNNVATGRYQLLAQGVYCKSEDSVVINAQPFIPVKPTPTITHPTCTNSKAVVVVSNKEANVVYTLTQGGAVKYTADQNGVFNDVTAGKYRLVANAVICATADSSTVNEQPPTPSSPSLVQVGPSFCSATGSVTVSSPTGTGWKYSKDGGTTWQDAAAFNGIAAGTGASLSFLVKNTFGCISAPARVCAAPTGMEMTENSLGGSTLTAMAAPAATTVVTTSKTVADNTETVTPEQKSSKYLGSAQLTETTVTVKTIPNPFSTRVRFMIENPVAGRGVLEIFNSKGQKLKTVYQGYIYAGSNYFDLTLPLNSRAELFYVLKIGDKQVSGTMLQVGNKF